MSWGIWISKDTRVNQKEISASLAISKPCRVEVKLQVKIVITIPLPCPSHITESTQLFGTMENSPTEFSVESPTSTNTSGFEHSVEVRTDEKSETSLVDGFPSMNIFSTSRPLYCFHVFSCLTSCYRVITLFLHTLAQYYVNDVNIHTSEHLKDLGSHFLKTAFGPSVWIQIHINIDFTKFGASAFIISFLWLRCGAYLMHQLTGADNLVQPTERVFFLLCVHYSSSPFAVQYYHPMLGNSRQSRILDPIPWIVDSGSWIFSGTWILDSMP